MGSGAKRDNLFLVILVNVMRPALFGASDSWAEMFILATNVASTGEEWK